MNKSKSFKKSDDKFVQQHLYVEDYSLFYVPKEDKSKDEENKESSNIIIIDIL